MSIFPVGAGVGWIVFRPILNQLPEGVGVFFVLSDGVGADKGVDEGEAVRFPDEFDIGCRVIGDLGPVLLFSVMPNGRKAGFAIFVREVFEFAVEKFVCFFDGVCSVIRARGPRPYVGKKRRGVLFAPCGIGIRIRWDIRFEPMLERTVIPFVLRGLPADESAAEAEGVGEAKG